MCRIEVVPNVVHNGQGDMSLKVRKVRIPPARHGIQVDHLGLLSAGATTLPRKHGTLETVLGSVLSGLWQSAVSI